MQKKSSLPTPTSSASWLRLAEYGDWPHPRGLQRFTPAAAHTMVRYFKSLRGRLCRKFGGLPVYIGHPDDAHFSGQSGHTDTRAYAWVTDLEARRDGLYGAFKWSTAGEELLGNAFYKFLSPRWAMEPLGKDTFQPVRLLSIGLTNQPNIPGEAIANSVALHSVPASPAPAIEPAQDTSATTQNAHTVRPPTTDASDTATHAPALCADDATPVTYRELRAALGVSNEVDPLEAISELREQSERFYRIACEQSDALGKESATLANARREHIGLVVENALLSGRIAPHETDAWRHSLEEDWDAGHAELRGRAPTLKTTAIANTRAPQAAASNTRADFLARVEAHAKATGLNFAAAWSDLKRRQPDLYQQFFVPAN